MPARSRAPQHTAGRVRGDSSELSQTATARAHPFDDDDDYGDALRPGGASGPCGSPPWNH